LNQLVHNAGKEPFVNYACRVHEVIRGTTPPRRKYKNFINKILGIIDNKHMNDACSPVVKIDLHQCAINTLIKSIADYVTLYGQEEPFIKLFYRGHGITWIIRKLWRRLKTCLKD
jgi:hypothetical protein